MNYDFIIWQNVHFIAAKQKLYNGIVDMFVESEDKFPVVMTDKAISDQVIMPLTNAVWYLSGNMSSLTISSSLTFS